jgi:hypothetical protein
MMHPAGMVFALTHFRPFATLDEMRRSGCQDFTHVATAHAIPMIRFPREDPVIIGGIGGSGTRLIAAILRVVGGYMGRVNASNDSRYMGTFIRRWLQIYLARIEEWKRAGEPEAMVQCFYDCLRRHLEDLPLDAPFWGWKNPPCLLLLPFLDRRFSEMRFIHVIRDGRDMAFSKNQYDLRNYGHLILTEDNVLRFWNTIWRLVPKDRSLRS